MLVVIRSKSFDCSFLLQLGWVCQYDALPTIAQSIFFIGAIFGGLIFGWIADQYGRIPALIGANLMGFLAGVATAFTVSFWQFTLCRFFVGFAFDNCFTMMYILGNRFSIISFLPWSWIWKTHSGYKKYLYVCTLISQWSVFLPFFKSGFTFHFDSINYL